MQSWLKINWTCPTHGFEAEHGIWFNSRANGFSRKFSERLFIMRICLGFVFILGVFAGPANAQVECSAPFSPVVPDGATASEERLNTVRQQVEAFMRDSDGYQNCLVTSLRQIEAEAARDEDEQVDPAVRRTTVARVNANQRLKIRTSEEFNAAARAYNEANPPEVDQDDPAAAPPPES